MTARPFLVVFFAHVGIPLPATSVVCTRISPRTRTQQEIEGIHTGLRESFLGRGHRRHSEVGYLEWTFFCLSDVQPRFRDGCERLYYQAT
jgi:hypothetical protein